MKKMLIVLSAALLLTACSSPETETKEETKKQSNKVTISEHCGDSIEDLSAGIADGSSVPATAECYLGSGAGGEITEADHIIALWERVCDVKIYEDSASEDIPQIDDGSIGFYFIWEDETDHMFAFLTSEYYIEDEFCYKTRSDDVKDLCDLARDFLIEERDLAASDDPAAAEERESTALSDAAVNPGRLSYAFGQDTETIIEVTYIDNGDEAHSVILFTPEWDRSQEAHIDGGYEIIKVREAEDALLLTVLCGDHYGHDEAKTYQLTVEDGRLIITEMDV